ncbi:MAG: glucuronyl hydrolase [Paenibacillus sp.]|nr:glucuronyl hydrolase [Paenibacillus sp.]
MLQRLGEFRLASSRLDYVHTARVAADRSLRIEQGRRVPFGWSCFSVAPDRVSAPVVLHWSESAAALIETADGRSVSLRITAAADVWEDVRLEVALAQSGQQVGEMVIRYADVFQIMECPLSAADAALAARQGLRLRMVEGDRPLWLFGGEDDVGGTSAVEEGHGGSGGRTGHPMFAPHFVLYDDDTPAAVRYERYKQQLASYSSLQQFCWKEGCVLDGLYDMSAADPQPSRYSEAIDRHLALYIDSSGALRYEDARTRIVDGTIYGIEATLPFAVIARKQPDHPSIRIMTDYYRDTMGADGALYDNDVLSAEGAYTVAYPLAVIAKQQALPQLEEWAIRQLGVRRERLPEGDALYLRRSDAGIGTFRNWIRGYTWYLLGFVRTLSELAHRADLEPYKGEFVRVAEIALSHQRGDGLWSCFVDEPDVLPDTSGSAGIAAALALGANAGLLPPSARERAALTLSTLQRHYLTADGILSGASQANKNGEALQRCDYRINAQVGMGLMAQLAAALAAEPVTARSGDSALHL